MWYYQNKEFTETPEEYQGFVYLITNKKTGMKYVGKKTFWSVRRIKQKGKTRRKVVRKESDWRKYYGSSATLQEDIETNGVDDFHREILHLCKTKGECSYYEAKEQFMRDVLMDETYYNSWISCKIHASHLNK